VFVKIARIEIHEALLNFIFIKVTNTNDKDFIFEITDGRHSWSEIGRKV